MKVMVAILSVAAAVTVAVGADLGYGYEGPASSGAGGQDYAGAASSGAGSGSGGPAQYGFQYDVDDQPSGNFFGHQEERDGDRTEGSYYVRLPDTRLMRVDYYADETGYHPTVTYEGEAQFPDGPQAAPSNAYSQPGAPAPAPGQSYAQPGPAPAPGPSPGQLYTPPGK
ncbi:pro-resilin-like [Eriocheir sinensis]|uniref:pro-resilin-like n=1 Tax=Eriocheir sinensis TaxID=95602 RepID=UPI0021C97757|nr:pro-resilin-like [Eriocheir sinensis]